MGTKRMRKTLVALVVSLVMSVGAFEVDAKQITVREWLTRCGHRIADSTTKAQIDTLYGDVNNTRKFHNCSRRTIYFFRGVVSGLDAMHHSKFGRGLICMQDYFERRGKLFFPNLTAMLRGIALKSDKIMNMEFEQYSSLLIVDLEKDCRAGKFEKYSKG